MVAGADVKKRKEMEMSDRTYFIVLPDSPVMAVINEAIERMESLGEAARQLEREFPGVKVWTWGNKQICGLEFPGDLPDGWRRSKGKDYAVPDKRTKTGKALAARLKSLPIGVDALVFSSMLSKQLKQKYDHYSNGSIYFTIWEQYGEEFVLGVPTGCETEPPGCIELKMSEYWKLREQYSKTEA